MDSKNEKISKIESNIDKDKAGGISVNRHAGGIRFRNMREAMETAKLMAVTDVAVRKHLRGNVGACLAIIIQAIEWGLSPFSVANKSYVVNDQLCYESQLIHAVIERRAPIVGRLRHKFEGEGENRRCTVWATVRGDSEPLSYTSPRIGDISPKNSPLWKTKPDLQLYYNTSRDWCRIYFPELILGVYARDEIEDDRDSRANADWEDDVPMPKPIQPIASQREEVTEVVEGPIVEESDKESVESMMDMMETA